MISEEKIAEIKQVAKISDFISPYVALKRRGRSITGLCPFHAEKTPSFSVNDERGFFHCFGCGEGGNVFKFLMKIESSSFPEAVRKVASQCGIEVPDDSGGASHSRRELMFQANAHAARYFRRCLLETEVGAPFLEYLGQRGISTQAAETFQIGMAPHSGDGLVRWLAKQGVDADVSRELGLLGTSSGRGSEALRDRFRSRLMFPIRDTQGRVVGFGGRVIRDDMGPNVPKYLNSSESEVYHKSKALYGLYEARQALRDAERLLLVEGYLDVIALHDAGVRNVVATCGTALTDEQARTMERFASEAVIVFDGDAAGAGAAARSIPAFKSSLSQGVWPRGVRMPAGEDPDTFVRKFGAERFLEAVAKAEPLLDDYVRHTVERAPKGTNGRARAAAELAAILGTVRDPFAYDEFVRKSALWTGFSEEVLRAQGHQSRQAEQAGQRGQGARDRRRAAQLPAPAAARPRGGAQGAEEMLVSLMLTRVEIVTAVAESGVLDKMGDGVWVKLASELIDTVRNSGGFDPAEFLGKLADHDRARVAQRLFHEDEVFADRERLVADCIKGIERTARRRHNLEIVGALRQKEELGVEVVAEDDLKRWKSSRQTE